MADGERRGNFYTGGGPHAADDQPARRDPQNWLQRLIASCLSIGIPKRALLEDYYPAELPAVLHAWNEMHAADKREAARTDPMTFFGSGGERIDG